MCEVSLTYIQMSNLFLIWTLEVEGKKYILEEENP